MQCRPAPLCIGIGERSAFLSQLLEDIFNKKTMELEAACRAANKDIALDQDIAEWQSFDDRIEE